MTARGPVALVVNPRSGAGRTARRLPRLVAAAQEALGPVTVHETRGPGDGLRCAREAAEGGAELVVSLGGDGTANEVVNGLMAAGGEAAFATVPAGTGSDLARTLGLSRDPIEAFRQVAAAAPRPLDVFRGRFATRAGGSVERFGVNVVGMGLAGDVVDRVNRSSKRLGGRVGFALATAAGLAAWRSPRVRVSWEHDDGSAGAWEGALVNLFACNGRYCGGGMLTGPSARLDDGLLDVVVIPDRGLLRLGAATPALYDGRIASLPWVVAARVRAVEAESLDGDWIPSDIDGEQPGGLPARVEVLPGALRVRAPGARSGPPVFRGSIRED